MHIVVIGDIHGENKWKQIIENEPNADLFIFLGDYFDSFHINTDTQCNNFLDIIAFKKENPDKVKLLIGNHDHHYIVGDTGTSGYQRVGKYVIEPILKDNLKYLQLCFKFENYLFTHAGISETFLNEVLGYGSWDKETIMQELNELFTYKPNTFVFNGYDTYGDDIEQTPIWIRPKSLMKSSSNLKKQGIIQIVGHTTQNKIDIKGKATGGKYYFIDTLNSNNEYLIIENNIFKSAKI